jgi:signal transduction histidine kinase
LDTHDSILQLAIRDDGIGRADASQGSGLVGLSDRVEALGGRLEVSSPYAGGTALLIEIPLGDRSGDASAEPNQDSTEV